MKRQINVVLDKGVQFSFLVPEGAPLTHEAARAWLDQQFLALGCAPLRDGGKVLTADKVLVVTRSAGAVRLGDPKWSADYAAAVAVALGKPLIRVDVPTMVITY